MDSLKEALAKQAECAAKLGKSSKFDELQEAADTQIQQGVVAAAKQSEAEVENAKHEAVDQAVAGAADMLKELEADKQCYAAAEKFTRSAARTEYDYKRVESAQAYKFGIKWRERGPGIINKDEPTQEQWRGQSYRAGSKRYANRGGGKAQAWTDFFKANPNLARLPGNKKKAEHPHMQRRSREDSLKFPLLEQAIANADLDEALGQGKQWPSETRKEWEEPPAEAWEEWEKEEAWEEWEEWPAEAWEEWKTWKEWPDTWQGHHGSSSSSSSSAAVPSNQRPPEPWKKPSHGPQQPSHPPPSHGPQQPSQPPPSNHVSFICLGVQ